MRLKTLSNMQKRCPGCGYTWLSRVESPKNCPYCKYRLRKIKKEKE